MKITSLKEIHIQEIIDLSNTVFGQGYLTIEYLNKYIVSSKKKGFVALSASNNLTGFILVESLSVKKFSNQVLKEKEWCNNHFSDYKSIKLIHQIAVNSAFQNKGIATNLVNYIQKQITTETELICCFAWVKDNFTSLKKILLKNDFIFIRKINNYWLKDSIIKKYDCVICGSPPCKCSAEIYVKKKSSFFEDFFRTINNLNRSNLFRFISSIC